MTRPILIVKTGSTLPELAKRRGDFEQWIGRAMGVGPDELAVVAPYRDEPLPAPAAYAGVVVTGSAAYVSDRQPWSERTAAWLPGVLEADVPLLAICYGHQLLAHALGGHVAKNPRGREIGTVVVDLSPAVALRDPLLGGLPRHAAVHASHVESVLELPAEATLLGASDADPHHAFALGERAWGVQFHPEFDADVVRGYIEARRDDLAQEGLDATSILEAVHETSVGDALLRRFRELTRSCAPSAPPLDS